MEGLVQKFKILVFIHYLPCALNYYYCFYYYFYYYYCLDKNYIIFQKNAFKSCYDLFQVN